MKRIFSILLCGVLALSLTACGQRSGSQTQQPFQGQQTSQDGAQSQPDEEQSYGKDGKTLVVYYSASGNTKAVAEYIAGATNGDLFEIVPAEPYSSASSGMGQSGQLLEELAKGGEWQEGRRFRSGASEADVTDWVNSLGL